MRFGVFIEELRRGNGAAAWFDETPDPVDAAETWGLNGVCFGEIHFNPLRSVPSSLVALAGYRAARTTRVGIRIAITVLPPAHPLRVAEAIVAADSALNATLPGSYE